MVHSLFPESSSTNNFTTASLLSGLLSGIESTQSVCAKAITTILTDAQSNSDPITACGHGAVHLLSKSCSSTSCRPRATDLLQLAHDKIHAFPFKDVPLCWRRLYTDASIVQAVALIDAQLKLFIEQKDSAGASITDWLSPVVHALDRALIIAGAPGTQRRELIDELLDTLPLLPCGLPRFAIPGDVQGEGEDAGLALSPTSLPERFPPAAIPDPPLTSPLALTPSAALPLHIFHQHLTLPTPLHLTHLLDHWPARSTHPWTSPRYLLSRTHAGRRLVPLELGRSYVDAAWSQKLLPFGSLLHHMLSPLPPSAPAYLAQHDLFAQLPRLRADVLVPDYCYVSDHDEADGGDVQLNAWFGPAGTMSPLHTDPHHNILAQVVGRKYVRLYAPAQGAALYPREAEAEGVDMSNTSCVDVAAWMEGRGREDIRRAFPAFEDAVYSEVLLGEGEALFIPRGWWHFVRGLQTSCSVSFWWD
ncbi:MAG: hypothetical protein M1829_002661 [Trizodia sp. TS-e1964]|nr:MAG: hypothetical protein M1829_002661 [Trizodia sp. TS-e1964]